MKRELVITSTWTRVCVLTPRTPRHVISLLVLLALRMSPDLSHVGGMFSCFFLPAEAEQKQQQHFGLALWGSPCRETEHPHNPWCVSRTTGSKYTGRVWPPSNCALWMSEYAGGPGVAPEGRTARQFWGNGIKINKLLPDPWVSPLCRVTSPTANSSVLSCHLLARLTPEAGERRCGNRRATCWQGDYGRATSASPSLWLKWNDFLLWG